MANDDRSTWLRIDSKVCRMRAHAGDTSQTSAAIARNESWQPTSNRYIGLIARVNRAGERQRVGRPARRSADRGRAKSRGHDGRAHDRRGQSNQKARSRTSSRRRSDKPAVGARQHAKDEQKRHGERLQLEPGDGQQVRRARSSERIVDLGIDLFAPAQKQRGGQRSRRRIKLLEQPGRIRCRWRSSQSVNARSAAPGSGQKLSGSSTPMRRRIPWACRNAR